MNTDGRTTSEQLYIPTLLVIGGCEALLMRCYHAAKTTGLSIKRCEVGEVFAAVPRRKPFAIVVPVGVFRPVAQELLALARDVRSALLPVDPEVSVRELEAMLAGAIDGGLSQQERRGGAGRYSIVEGIEEEAPFSRRSAPPSSWPRPSSAPQSASSLALSEGRSASSASRAMATNGPSSSGRATATNGPSSAGRATATNGPSSAGRATATNGPSSAGRATATNGPSSSGRAMNANESAAPTSSQWARQTIGRAGIKTPVPLAPPPPSTIVDEATLPSATSRDVVKASGVATPIGTISKTSRMGSPAIERPMPIRKSNHSQTTPMLSTALLATEGETPSARASGAMVHGASPPPAPLRIPTSPPRPTPGLVSTRPLNASFIESAALRSSRQ